MPGRRQPPRDDPSGFNERDFEDAANAFMRLPPNARIAVVVLILIAAAAYAFVYYKQHHPSAGPVATSTTGPSGPAGPLLSPHLLLGNPSDARDDEGQRDNYLMLKPYFALSYNDNAGEPNWVSWRVVGSDLGTAPRKPVFDPDLTLPAEFRRVMTTDYAGFGFDRGHMCPHSDRAANTDMSYATFVMTNIIPQAPNVNQKAWAQLETYCRDLVRNEQDHLYVVSGPTGRGGVGSRGSRDTIGKANPVVVPSACWKVIVAVPNGGSDGSTPQEDFGRIDAATRVIAVVMPNDNDAVGEAWAGFRTSAAEVERRTGYHLFTRLPADVAAALRAKVDDRSIPPPRPMRRGTGAQE